MGDVYEYYADRTVQSGYKAGCTCAVNKNGLLHQVDMRLPNWSSTTQTELTSTLLSTGLLSSFLSKQMAMEKL